MSFQPASLPSQPLFELLAATVLPVDAPGVETLNLMGSTGLLLVDLGEHLGSTEEEANGDGEFDEPHCSSSSTTAAFLLLLRDALMSPLCRTARLLFSGIRGGLPRTASSARNGRNLAADPAAGRSSFPRRVMGPEDVKVLCEAVSACVSLRSLDLAGCDLSGAVGAAAAAAAVACLIRNDDGNDHFPFDHLYLDQGSGGKREENGDNNVRIGRAAADFGLNRLSLRACRLGAAGLSAVIGTLLSAFYSDDWLVSAMSDSIDNSNLDADHYSRQLPSSGAARWDVIASERGGCWAGGDKKSPPPRLPRVLDLSDNRPTASTNRGPAEVGENVSTEISPDPGSPLDPAVVVSQGHDEERREDGEDCAALRQLAVSLRVLKKNGLASVGDATDLGQALPR